MRFEGRGLGKKHFGGIWSRVRSVDVPQKTHERPSIAIIGSPLIAVSDVACGRLLYRCCCGAGRQIRSRRQHFSRTTQNLQGGGPWITVEDGVHVLDDVSADLKKTSLVLDWD